MPYHTALPVPCRELHKMLVISQRVSFHEFKAFVRDTTPEGAYEEIDGDILLTVESGRRVATAIANPRDATELAAAQDWMDTLPDVLHVARNQFGFRKPSGFVPLYELKRRPLGVKYEVRVEVPVEVKVHVPVPILEFLPTLVSPSVSMSSLEIAELTGKRHDHVMRDIHDVLEELESHSPNLGSEQSPNLGSGATRILYTADNGQEYGAYELNQELTYTLLAGYSVGLRHKIVKRWLQLEGAETQRRSAALDTLKHAVALGLVDETRVLAEVVRLACPELKVAAAQ